MTNDSIHHQVLRLAPSLIAARRDFHKYAEGGWVEFRTASIVANRLKELGYALTLGRNAVKDEYRLGVPSEEVLEAERIRALEQGADPEMVALMAGGFTGIWADMQFGDGNGPRFAMRFDMDANDVTECQEPSHRPASEGFASVNKGFMHACGHDGHTAIGLAVAEMLAGMKDSLRGTVRLIFQSAEEGARGAYGMMTAGCVAGFDFFVGVHIGFKASRKGMVICGVSGLLASVKMDAHYTGKSAHAGAAPQDGKNALLAACAATTNLHAIPRHGDGATRVNVGKLRGGQGRNVIPPEALVSFEVRGATNNLNEYMEKEARRVVLAAADMWDCGCEIKVMGSCGNSTSDREITNRAMAVAQKVAAYDTILGIEDFGAGEDVSHMMEYVQKHGGQATFIQLGTDKAAGHHNDRFDFDDTDLVPAVEMLALLTRDYLGT